MSMDDSNQHQYQIQIPNKGPHADADAAKCRSKPRERSIEPFHQPSVHCISCELQCSTYPYRIMPEPE